MPSRKASATALVCSCLRRISDVLAALTDKLMPTLAATRKRGFVPNELDAAA
ncbi:MAG: hypothetical protein IPK13_10480 [Deltaproteobacteria bacterium]|nr:hypothetical protein [Deltaproteobacteria bacterium]MBK8011747.1 hypothetical protein [Deltaproteobacteria bacterium]MBK8011768.1 hypothetical protein [Deltaproteobacteria bacterium]